MHWSISTFSFNMGLKASDLLRHRMKAILISYHAYFKHMYLIDWVILVLYYRLPCKIFHPHYLCVSSHLSCLFLQQYPWYTATTFLILVAQKYSLTSSSSGIVSRQQIKYWMTCLWWNLWASTSGVNPHLLKIMTKDSVNKSSMYLSLAVGTTLQCST